VQRAQFALAGSIPRFDECATAGVEWIM